MMCVIVAAACWLPPTPLTPLPPPPVLVRSEAQEHGWRAPPPPSGPAAQPPVTPPTRHQSSDVEQWRPLVGAWFGPNTDAALTVIACESGGDPAATNPSSGAAGLFQHLPRYWADRSAAAGFVGADIYDPEANVAVAAWLSGGGTAWTHWTCRP